MMNPMNTRALGQKIRSRLARLAGAPGTAQVQTDVRTMPPASLQHNHLDGSSVPVRDGARPLQNGERGAALERALGLEFDDPTLLREALTHRSYLNEINQAWPSNERLEFLGDAVLGLITTDYLFQRFPKLGEGELTNLRSALVRTETLARFAHEINLGQYLFLGRGEEISL